MGRRKYSVEVGAKNSNFSPRMLAYMQWVALPTLHRQPRTQAEIAKQLGVSVSSLMKWQKKAGFWDAVRREARARLEHSFNDMYEALRRQAVAGDINAIKYAFAVTGEYRESDNDERRESATERLNQLAITLALRIETNQIPDVRLSAVDGAMAGALASRADEAGGGGGAGGQKLLGGNGTHGNGNGRA